MARTDPAATRYARALLRVARGRGETDRPALELETAADALVSEARLVEFWENPIVEESRKEKVLSRALEELSGEISDTTRRLLEVMLRNDRLGKLGDVAEVYRRLADREAGRVEVTVRTAMPLEEGQRENLSSALEAALGRSVRMKLEEDPSLLAGIVVQVGDRLYDASARGRLERFKRRLAV